MTHEARGLEGRPWLQAMAVGTALSGRQNVASHHGQRAAGKSVYGIQRPGLRMAGGGLKGRPVLRISKRNRSWVEKGLWRSVKGSGVASGAQGQEDQLPCSHQVWQS